MSRFTFIANPRAGAILTLSMLAGLAVAPVHAQPPASNSAPMPGRVDFDFPAAPPANVEVDLSQGMLAALTGIGQAAIGGATEALQEASTGQSNPAVDQSAEHLKAVNQIVSALTGVVHEVRVRVYEGVPASQAVRGSMVAHYQQKLQDTAWDNVVRVREDDATVNVCVMRDGNAIRGVFVMVAEDEDVVMVNVVCELTPEKIQQVTHQATKIGLKVGLEQAIQEAMKELQRAHH